MRTPVNADLSRSSQGLCGAGAQPRLISERPAEASGPAGGAGGVLPVSPLFSKGPRLLQPGLLPQSCVSACLWDAGGCITELWHGVRSRGGRCVSEEALLLCHAYLGGGIIKKSNNPAALFICLSLFLLPPSHP